VKILTKENENAKADITTMQATIADLKEQVRQMILSFFIDDKNRLFSPILFL
jgi:hypothetical protein